jgi:2-polyprenyl-3-methyl-5-hydroxy-6-metoxy-1,4-benzoquinol methylase
MSLAMKRNPDADVARFWNRQAHAFDTIYSGRKGRLARALDRWLRADMYQRFDWTLERGGDVTGARVCDIGCGSGRFVTAFAKRGADKVVGIDVAPEMIKLAERLAVEDGVAPQCEFRIGDVLQQAGDETFDLTVAVGLWDYVPDPTERLRVIRRMTTGRFLSTWPRLWTWRVLQRKARLAASGCPVYFYRRPQVERLLTSAGFVVTDIKVIGKLYCVEAQPAGERPRLVT